MLVGVCKRGTGVAAPSDDVVEVDGPAFFYLVADGASGDVAHDEVAEVRFLADAVDTDDMRVFQIGRYLCLVFETGDEVLVPEIGAGQHLDRSGRKRTQVLTQKGTIM